MKRPFPFPMTKRPDEMAIFPWRMGKCMVWDFKYSDIFASSHFDVSSSHFEKVAKQAKLTCKQLEWQYKEEMLLLFWDCVQGSTSGRDVLCVMLQSPFLFLCFIVMRAYYSYTIVETLVISVLFWIAPKYLTTIEVW